MAEPTEHLPSDESPPAWNAEAPPATDPAATESAATKPPATEPPASPPPTPPPAVRPVPRSGWRARNVSLLGVVAIALIACILGAGLHPSVVDDRDGRDGRGPGLHPNNGGPDRHRGQPVPGATPSTPAPSPSTS